METIGMRIVFDKLHQSQVSVRHTLVRFRQRALGWLAGKTNTARVSPAPALVLCVLGRLPFPRPLERSGRAAISAVVANESNIRVLVEVRIGVELPGYQGFYLPGRGGVDVGERIDAGVEGGLLGAGRCVRGVAGLRSLAYGKGELED